MAKRQKNRQQHNGQKTEEQTTTQWPKDRRTDNNTMAKRQKNRQQHNGQKTEEEKDKQRSIKHRHQTKDRVKRTPLKCLY
jgi:hypothetical protein